MDLEIVRKLTPNDKESLFQLVREHEDAYPVILRSRNKPLYALIQEFPGVKFNQKLFNFLHDIRDIPLCKICNTKPISWKKKFSKGYSKFCSLTCANKDDEHKEKIKATHFKRTGTYNGKSKEVLEKQSLVYLERFGNKSFMASEYFKRASEKTIIERYGVKNTMHYGPIVEKCNGRYKRKTREIGGVQYTYQGYEDVFIELCLKQNLMETVIFGTKNVPTIAYLEDGVTRRYFPDFVFSDQCLVVEIKSAWTFNRFENKNMLKYKHSIDVGYDMIFLICDSTSVLRVLGNIGGYEKFVNMFGVTPDFQAI